MIRKLLVGLVITLIGSAAAAAELDVRAPVVSVEPIAAPAETVADCPDQPASGALGATLRWDLGLTCRQRVVRSDGVQGYRVFYRWDNRIHSLVMRNDPGATVALKVRIN
jgi:hypothetical protein